MCIRDRAGAGVGCLGLVDDDLVSITNLQRQVLYSEKELAAASLFDENISLLNLEDWLLQLELAKRTKPEVVDLSLIHI